MTRFPTEHESIKAIEFTNQSSVTDDEVRAVSAHRLYMAVLVRQSNMPTEVWERAMAWRWEWVQVGQNYRRGKKEAQKLSPVGSKPSQ